MPAGRFSRNTVLAGAFVLLTVGLLVAAIALVAGGGGLLSPARSRYIIRFSLRDGADGLEKGSKVKLGGRQIGNVKSVEFEPKPETHQPIESLLVTVEVDAKLDLYKNAQVSLVRPLLGTNSALNFLSLRGEGDSEVVAPGGRIDGKIGPPAFLSQADYAKAQAFVDRLDRWSRDVDRDWPEQYAKITSTIDDVHKSMSEIRELSTRANDRSAGWIKQIDDLLGEVGPRFKRFTDDAQAGLDKVRATVDLVNRMVADNQPAVDAAVKNATEFIARVNGPVYNDLVSILGDGRETMARVKETARRAQEWVTLESPRLSDIVDQAALAAQDLKLTTAEVRAAPWRLLYQPNKKELENELLYNTMRSYSRSLSEARSAADSLRAASEANAATPGGFSPAVSRERVDAIAQKLQDAVAKSQEQEKRLMELWEREGGPRAGKRPAGVEGR